MFLRASPVCVWWIRPLYRRILKIQTGKEPIAYLEMPLPRLLAGRDHARIGIVQEIRILPQAAPHAKPLSRIVGLVDQMGLLGESAVLVAQGDGGALPGARLEAVVLLEAKLHGLAEGTEEGGLVGGVPAEARGPPVGVATRRQGRVGGSAARVAVLVIRHGGGVGSSSGELGCIRR